MGIRPEITKGTLHQELRVKSENFFGETPNREIAYLLFENFRPFSCEKTLYSGSHVSLITPTS